MTAQTRIFSVATTIACLALTSPGFAQAYGGGAAVQVDLGALNDLPGAGPAQDYPAPPTNLVPHYRSSRVANADDLPTTIIGGGGDSVAPVTDVQTMRASPYMPARHVKPQSYYVAPPKHHTAPVVHKAAEAKPPQRRSKKQKRSLHHISSERTIVTPPLATTTDELNYIQLVNGKPTLPGGTPLPSGTRDVAMLPPPQPADQLPDLITNETPPSQTIPNAPMPMPALPPAHIDHVAAPPPTQDDYDEPRRRPAPTAPIVPIMPPAVPPPAATPDDLIDEAPPARQKVSRVISDPYASRATTGPVPVTYDTSPVPIGPAAVSAQASGAVGYYQIPSRISLDNPTVVSAPSQIEPAPIQPERIITPVPAATAQPQQPTPTFAPIPKMLTVAPPTTTADTTQALNRAEEIKSTDAIDATPLNNTPADNAPTPLITNRPSAKPVSDGPDTTNNLNHLADTKSASTIEAMPLDAPTPLTTPVTTPAAKMAPALSSSDKSSIEKASVVPAQEAKLASAVSAPAAKSADALAVTYAPGSTTLSPDANANLDGLVSRLKDNADLRVELRSMASASGKDSSSKARRTSLSRALDIKSYLARQGISEDRIDVRALGAPAGEAATDRVDFFLMR